MKRVIVTSVIALVAMIVGAMTSPVLVCLEPPSLIVLPDARSNGIDREKDPFLSLINHAQTEILMASYKLQEKKLPQKDMLDALERAVKRGVKVHLIAEDRLSDMEVINDSETIMEGDSLKAYKERGVKVYHIPQKYKNSHTKFIIVDGHEAILGTTNFDKDPEGHANNKRPSRDFAIKFVNPRIVKELTESFWKDPQNLDFEEKVPHLLWGPKGQREKLKKLIEYAENSIKIYQQDITDAELVETLCQLARNGVVVELIMSPHPFGFNKPDQNKENQQKLREAGGFVYLTNTLNIHAKVMIIDDKLMYLGSINFYQPAIDHDRNVGLLITDRDLITQVSDIFAKDKAER